MGQPAKLKRQSLSKLVNVTFLTFMAPKNQRTLSCESHVFFLQITLLEFSISSQVTTYNTFYYLLYLTIMS